MLALTRSDGQAIRLDLGDGREVLIQFSIQTGHKKARFLIKAPDDVKIWRLEIDPKYAKELQEATA